MHLGRLLSRGGATAAAPRLLILCGALALSRSPGAESPAPRGGSSSPLATGRFKWIVSEPVLAPAQRPQDPCYSVKDPSVIYYQDRWHLFCTIRSEKRSHQIEYLSFDAWPRAARAQRHILQMTNGYFCAPQVFFFEPQKKWYLIYQALDANRPVALQPVFSTTTTLANPDSWTAPAFLFPAHPANVEGWIDFWVICDEAKAHLFFTSNNGKLWRADAPLGQFPFGWTQPQVVLRADIFEASHTYRLKGPGNYLTIVESVGPGGRRYYKAYLADQLDGEWKPLADSLDKPFAGPANVQPQGQSWTDSFSHGELIRSGYDQRLEVDPAHLRFLFQGVSDAARAGKKYGEIPWRLGLLEPAW